MTDTLNTEQAILPAVLRLQADYARLIDARDAQAWSRFFTPDGVLSLGAGEIAGQAQLVRFAEDSPTGIHLPGIPSVEVDDDGTVRASSRFVFLNPAGRQLVAGGYRDVFARSGAGVLLARRDIEILGRMEL